MVNLPVQNAAATDDVVLRDASTFRRLMTEFFDHFDTGRLTIGKGLSFEDHQLVRGFVDGGRRALESTNHRYLHEEPEKK